MPLATLTQETLEDIFSTEIEDVSLVRSDVKMKLQKQWTTSVGYTSLNLLSASERVIVWALLTCLLKPCLSSTTNVPYRLHGRLVMVLYIKHNTMNIMECVICAKDKQKMTNNIYYYIKGLT